jgi:UDP-glucose 4-epimerase
MKVLVTGGAGFLGSHVAEEFVDHGHDVSILDRVEPARELLDRVSYVSADLLDLNLLTTAFRGMDAICHLAGVGDVYLAAAEPYTAAAYNAVGSANVAEAARRNAVGRLVYASTWEVYGSTATQPVDENHACRPDHPYNISKYAGELLVLSYDRLHNVPTVALRLGTAYGLRMRPNSVFSLFINRARSGEPIVINGSGEQSRQFTHARDIAAGFRLAAEGSVRGRAINLTATENVSIRQLAEFVAERYATEIRFAPARPGDIHPAIIDSTLAWRVLGWRPKVLFRQGLCELIDSAEQMAHSTHLGNGVIASDRVVAVGPAMLATGD